MSSARIADFYILPSAELTAQHYFTCKLTEKALHQRHQIYICCPEASIAEELNTLLYSFRPDSFLPHALLTSPLPPDLFEQAAYPILIGAEQRPAPDNWLVINLADEPFLTTNRVAEIVIQEESVKLCSRKKFTRYKQQAFDLRSHQL